MASTILRDFFTYSSILECPLKKIEEVGVNVLSPAVSNYVDEEKMLHALQSNRPQGWNITQVVHISIIYKRTNNNSLFISSYLPGSLRSNLANLPGSFSCLVLQQLTGMRLRDQIICCDRKQCEKAGHWELDCACI